MNALNHEVNRYRCLRRKKYGSLEESDGEDHLMDELENSLENWSIITSCISEKKVVGGTPYDFRVPRLLRTMLPRVPMGGYELNFCITQGTEQDLTFHARALHPCTGRVLEVYSNQPGMEFYTGNLLPDPDKIVEPLPTDAEEENEVKSQSEVAGEEGSETSKSEKSENGEEALGEGSEGKVSYGYVPLMGKNGTFYKKHGLFCFMPQNYPDAVNHKNFPSPVLNPGEVYVHRIQYKFGLLIGKYV